MEGFTKQDAITKIWKLQVTQFHYFYTEIYEIVHYLGGPWKTAIAVNFPINWNPQQPVNPQPELPEKKWVRNVQISYVFQVLGGSSQLVSG